MKVLLINPPFQRFFGGGKSPKLPLGLCYIASYLTYNGYETFVYDAEFNPIGSSSVLIKEVTENIENYFKALDDMNNEIWKEIKNKIKSYSPDVVGISVKTATFKAGLNIAKLCKEIDKNIVVIMGGPHICCNPEDIGRYDFVDYGVIGEGEITTLELLKNIENRKTPSNIKGVVYKNNGKTVITPRRELIKELDSIPIPEHEHIIDLDKIPREYHGEIITGRGCPYSCTFCASSLVWEKKVRFRKPEKVVEEIEYILNKFGTNYFYIEDDTFTIKKDFAIKICDLLIEKNLPIKWSCETRANLVDEELIKKLKEAGCDDISIGVESGSDETLEKIKKRY
jgi:radical SAM superfamily enzyme YgiQ (UPF0313 family)